MKLETKRLILRKPKMSDWKDIAQGVGDIEVSKMLLKVPYPYHKKDAIAWLKRVLEEVRKKQKIKYEFMIELKSEKKVIGCIALIKIDRKLKEATTGSWINKKYWRQGYITEAKITVNDFAFNRLKLKKLKTDVYVDNKASNATQKKMGYKLVGKIKKAKKCLATGKIHDENVYELKKSDWKKTRARLIKNNRIM